MGRRSIFIVLVLLVVLGLVIWVIVAHKNGGSFLGNNPNSPNDSSSTKPQTYQPISGPVSVPNKGGTASENTAVPTIQTAAGPNTTSQFRGFNLAINSSSFTPDTIIAKVGDVVHLNISSSGNYDFTQPDYGIKVQLPSSKTTVVEFQVTAAGKFTFYCSSCGGPSSGPVGYLTVSP